MTTSSSRPLAVADLSARLRQRLEDLMGRVRVALDLPSRTELLELNRRLEELDQRIAKLAAERVEAMARVSPGLPAGPEPDGPAEEPDPAP